MWYYRTDKYQSRTININELNKIIYGVKHAIIVGTRRPKNNLRGT